MKSVSMKLLTASTALVIGTSEAVSARKNERHPLLEAGPEVNSIVREDGGVSMRVKREMNNKSGISQQELQRFNR